jgi:hypothetical protein
LCGIRPDSANVFHYFTDSNFYGLPRAQTGVMILLNGVPVHWRSNKQPVSSDSPACAEIYALKEGVKDGRLFNWVAEEMGMNVSWPFVVQVDNNQAISFQKDTCINSKIRGSIDIRLRMGGRTSISKDYKYETCIWGGQLGGHIDQVPQGPETRFNDKKDRRFSKI